MWVQRAFALVAAVVLLAAAGPSDPFLWLEDVSGARAMTWVKAENAKTLAVLQHDPHFAGFYRASLGVNGSRDRIPTPEIINGAVYNFWQDAAHVRGIWRTTSIADYAHAKPHWTTVIDVDALAKTEGKNWDFQGADCESPSRTRCLISLSEGGEDASTVREFDLTTRRFVPDGFVLPHAKQRSAWIDDDTLAVSRPWEPGQVTASGYAYVVKTLKRGEPLSAATEITRGVPADVSVGPGVLLDGDGHRLVFIQRGVSFFENQTSILTTEGLRALNIPLKASLTELIGGRLLITLNEAWKTDGHTFPAGDLVSVGLDAALADPQHLVPTIVYAPGPRETLEGVASTRDRLVVATYENVRGRAAVYTPLANGGWSVRKLPVPDDASIDLDAADRYGSTAYISITRFLTPTTLLQLDAHSMSSTAVKSLPPMFDGSNDVVEQHEATSKDGTRIPYFIVRPKHLALDGRNPTILYAYGGFAVSETPFYSGSFGRLWYAHNGVFVLANIRGGGEFGPAWHEAGLKTHRQRIYDDFTAVSRDLIVRKITSPAKLGIMGGSNGGLLMGVAFTQHPELYGAVDIQVPLLDMLRFEKIAAGASWAGEYGSVSVPKERAFLASISPYNNIKPGVRYPQPLIWTTTKDDRVGPQHARKFAAKLASMKIPYFFYEVTEGGHGSGTNINERSFTTALEFTYFARKLTSGSP